MTDQEFQGFGTPEENWSKLPHSLIAALPTIKSASELKVILYILRHTWGFHETEKRISLDEFANGRKKRGGSRMDGGTGMSIPAIRNGIKRAIEHGFITVETDNSDKARVKKYYSLNQTVRKLQSDCKKVTPRVQESCNRTKKETIETNPKKISATAPSPPVIQEPTIPEGASEQDAPHSKQSEEQKGDPPATSEKKPNGTYLLAQLLSEVCEMDFAANKGRLLREAKLLKKAHPPPTPALVNANYGPNGLWYVEDWRGKRGDLPRPSTIRETWKQFAGGTYATHQRKSNSTGGTSQGRAYRRAAQGNGNGREPTLEDPTPEQLATDRALIEAHRAKRAATTT